MPKFCPHKRLDVVIGGDHHGARVAVPSTYSTLMFARHDLSPAPLNTTAPVTMFTSDAYTRRCLRLYDRSVVFYAHDKLTDREASEALWDYLMRRVRACCDG